MTWVGLFFVLWAGWIAGGTVLALVRWNRHQRSRPVPQRERGSGFRRPAVLLVRPCSGSEHDLLHRLLSIRDAIADTPPSVRFTVDDPRDPAWPIIRQAAEILARSGWDASALVVRRPGFNRKVAQLVQFERLVGFDVLLTVDSDVDLSRFDVDAVVATLTEDRNVGLVWAPTIETGNVKTWGDLCSQGVLTGSLHAFPWLAMLDPSGVTGKVLAVRKDALEAVGGFSSLTDVLGEDFELGQRMRRAGFQCRVGSSVAVASASLRTVASVYRRFRRWIVVVRTQRPIAMVGYPLLLAPLPAFVVGLVWTGFDPVTGAASSLVIGSRLLLQGVANRQFHPRGLVRAGTELFLADAILMTAWLSAWVSQTVVWRGRKLRAIRGGVLKPNAGATEDARSPPTVDPG